MQCKQVAATANAAAADAAVAVAAADETATTHAAALLPLTTLLRMPIAVDEDRWRGNQQKGQVGTSAVCGVREKCDGGLSLSLTFA